jgi:hypothetical protein
MRLGVVLPIGKPTQPVAQAQKRPLNDMVHWERLGNKR